MNLVCCIKNLMKAKFSSTSEICVNLSGGETVKT